MVLKLRLDVQAWDDFSAMREHLVAEVSSAAVSAITFANAWRPCATIQSLASGRMTRTSASCRQPATRTAYITRLPAKRSSSCTCGAFDRSSGPEVAKAPRLSSLSSCPGGRYRVFGGAIHHDFERYRSEQVGLGPIVSINVRGFTGKPLLPLAERCLLDAAAFSQIVERTKRAGGLTIVPHIGTGSVWRLAASIAEATGLEVCVASPPLPLTRRVNDKLWFARLAAEVLGETALPPTYAAYGPAVLAHRLRLLARSAERVVVKVPDSAGSVGNVCLTAREVADASLSDIRSRMLRVLRAVGW